MNAARQIQDPDNVAGISGTVSQDGANASIRALIIEAREGLSALQQDDGHWVFELEADATIPAEYIMLEHFLDEIDDELEAKLAVYLRNKQGSHGGWPLFHDGDFNVSASVKAYYALKLAGDPADAPHMIRARDAILAHGGAATCNVFTRIALALFDQAPWRAVPVMPVEIMLLPRWFPFHLSKVSYWSRTVIAPLLILMTLKPHARNPRGVNIAELFLTPANTVSRYLSNPTGSPWGELCLVFDKVLRVVEGQFPKKARQRGLKAAVGFIKDRMNGEDGLGGIFPAMANTVMAFDALGIDKNDPDFVIAKNALRKLLVIEDEHAYCQPCLSPVWDTGLAVQAMMEAGVARDDDKVAKAADWMADRQILDTVGDWAAARPNLRPGGWAFEYKNDHYPDVDDTAAVAIALDRTGNPKFKAGLDRAVEWVVGMQGKDGGWGSFDADNTYEYLNHIPFADHGALLDGPTEDVSARCISMLAQIDSVQCADAIKRGLDYLARTQQPDGSWYGRWGTNYIYGTWSVLSAYNAAGVDMNSAPVRKAVEWLESCQRGDGGWGEDGATYWNETKDASKTSTPSQTAWALLALMAAGDVESDAVRRGVEYLLNAPRTGAKWTEPEHTAVGFPRVFYLRYHGYSVYFPLWALARYDNLRNANATSAPFGM
jgi:squalene-hopene/tetraprenyl-beta-curcumene cyclase